MVIESINSVSSPAALALAEEVAAERARAVPQVPLAAHPLDPIRPMTFSPGALKALSLGLAAQGVAGLLQVWTVLGRIDKSVDYAAVSAAGCALHL